MRLYVLVTLGGAVLSGCTTTQVTRPVGMVPVSRASIEQLSALVPASSSAPRCEQRGPTPVLGATAVSVVYPGEIARQVTVNLDPAGDPTAYFDVRGDLTHEDGGERTTIGLYLDAGYAVLSNRASSGDLVIVEVPLDQAITSDRLDNPAATIERVLSECGRAI